MIRQLQLLIPSLQTPADVGEIVTFTGHGEDLDGSITGYSWESNIDEPLSYDFNKLPSEQWGKLILLQRGLEADDLAENLYQRLMTCYHRLGRRAEVLSVYERCKRIISASLGIEPSSETKAIRKSIFLQKS